MNAKSSSGSDHGASAAAHVDFDGTLQDPYAILGVARDASYDVIRRVYREKAKVCHPDLGSEPGREEEFKLLSWAHSIVGEQRRASHKSQPEYTNDLRPGAAPPPERPQCALVVEFIEEGRTRLRLGNAAEAERLARVALQRSRAETGAYVLLAEALTAQSRFTEATGCLLMALQLDRNCTEARVLLTRLQDRSKPD